MSLGGQLNQPSHVTNCMPVSLERHETVIDNEYVHEGRSAIVQPTEARRPCALGMSITMDKCKWLLIAQALGQTSLTQQPSLQTTSSCLRIRLAFCDDAVLHMAHTRNSAAPATITTKFLAPPQGLSSMLPCLGHPDFLLAAKLETFLLPWGTVDLLLVGMFVLYVYCRSNVARYVNAAAHQKCTVDSSGSA